MRFLLLSTLVLFLSATDHTGTAHGQLKPNLPDDKLRTLLETTCEQSQLPALGLGLIRDGKEVAVLVTGVRKRDTDTKATTADLWHLGSNSKSITALLFALLVDLGLIDWHTPLADLFPELANDWPADLKAITPQQLLTHTSGLPSNWPSSWFKLSGKESPAHYRLELLKQLPTIQLADKPGAAYQYSNLGYTVLGAVIDRVSRSTWEAEVAAKVFRPLGIRNAGFGPTATEDNLRQPWPHYASGKPVPVDAVLDNPPVMNPAGRIHMTIADNNRFLAETLRLARGEKGLLKAETTRKLFTNPTGKGPHCLGGWISIHKGKDWILTHNGSNTMNYCTAVLLPERNVAAFTCTNIGGDVGQKGCGRVLIELSKEK